MVERKVRGHRTLVKPGDVFGRLTVVDLEPGTRRAMAVCRCECGNETKALPYQLTSGKTRSCGCLRAERTGDRARSHGESGTKLHRLWKSIVTRTGNPNFWAWDRYGGRGIAMDPEWRHDYGAFRDYVLANLGPPPTPRHTMDRIDNDIGYIRGNLRWATRQEQRWNAGGANPSIRWVELDGQRVSLREACRRLGFDINAYVLICQKMRHGETFESAARPHVKTK